MLRRAFLKPKRDKPRRKAPERCPQPQKKRGPTAEEKRHHARVRSMPCLVCGGPSTLHHVTASIHGGRIARSEQRVVPLCGRHHQIIWGPRESVEALGHPGFFREYGIDLLTVADRLWEERDG